MAQVDRDQSGLHEAGSAVRDASRGEDTAAQTLAAQTLAAQTQGGQTQGGQSRAERELAALIVTSLQLEVSAADIAPEMRLFGEGLGLDSIDALELALAISRAYGFDLRSDDEHNRRIFASLRALSAHVEAQRTR